MRIQASDVSNQEPWLARPARENPKGSKLMTVSTGSFPKALVGGKKVASSPLAKMFAKKPKQSKKKGC
jgi:hypothetical protein